MSQAEETRLVINSGKQGEVSVSLGFPFQPSNVPSFGQILKRTTSNKIYTASITGGNSIDKATVVRTYRLSSDEADELMTFLNDTCEEWTIPFTLEDPIDGDIENVYADRDKFRGFRPYQNVFYLATLTFQVST